MTDFAVLGQTVRQPIEGLDVFLNPGVQKVEMECLEFTSLCPVTAQPDFSTVTIVYVPDQLCIESKSLKLFLWQFREQGSFCETIAATLARAVMDAIACHFVTVEVDQAPRGGIRIRATASLGTNPLAGTST